MGTSKELGDWGERLAADFLCRAGYRLVAQNYRSRYGEIDLIVQNETDLVFVEVKLRKSAEFAYAAEYVDARKQQKLRHTAEFWLMEYPTNLQPRFDVIEVYAPYGLRTRYPQIYHLEGAFE